MVSLMSDAGQSNEPGKIGFDRNEYQRLYMQDVRAAKKVGLTTTEYRRRKHETTERAEHIPHAA